MKILTMLTILATPSAKDTIYNQLVNDLHSQFGEYTTNAIPYLNNIKKTRKLDLILSTWTIDPIMTALKSEYLELERLRNDYLDSSSNGQYQDRPSINLKEQDIWRIGIYEIKRQLILYKLIERSN